MSGELYGTPIHETKDINDLGLDNFDIGARAGIIFWATDKISVEGTCYYGLNNIYRNMDSENIKLKIRQLMLGIRYKIF